MRRLVYLSSARSDLLSILDYIAQSSGRVDVAETFVARLSRHCRNLALLPGIRSVVHEGYVVFFRYIDDRVEVVNIIEGHRDIDALLGDGGP
ncbi:hypothetical protein A6A04_01020 [Paramagnetospirillum marisnigri]|uniref:Plasmid stabilization protein n=1 Tax=Paramagnetospirillum marisnigri TaxID=1285242 RepID=A0A178MU20_9PROT|nr:type II toxin-antitoxin system RelE/ParE family toxin [Paramagnetospirillum marisnigri]OAN52306.1 hypothetical protein A6A04_01020 [Paramagnetospirillum marisnigri]